MINTSPRRLLYRFHIDPTLLGGCLLLCAIGFVTISSAIELDPNMLLRQGIRLLIGLCVMIALAQIPPSQLAQWAPWLYGVGLILLVGVMVAGTGEGAQRWLKLGPLRFQPSEFMKLFVPMVLAWYLQDKPLPPRLRYLFVAALLIAVPIFLVVKQPDLGTALLIAAAGGAVLFLAGLSLKLLILVALGLAGVAPLLWPLLHDYQRQRLITLLDPEQDPLGKGYHIIQSKIAVGSGGLYGKGWLHGTQSHLEFLPEHSTDFIFAVFCEEFGFIGVLVLFGIYVFVILRGLKIVLQAPGIFARLLGGSLILTFFVYIIVNTGMVVGQLPVVGVPLPFISYGGTSLVTLMASFGILMAIHTHKKSIY